MWILKITNDVTVCHILFIFSSNQKNIDVKITFTQQKNTKTSRMKILLVYRSFHHNFYFPANIFSEEMKGEKASKSNKKMKKKIRCHSNSIRTPSLKPSVWTIFLYYFSLYKISILYRLIDFIPYCNFIISF